MWTEPAEMVLDRNNAPPGWVHLGSGVGLAGWPAGVPVLMHPTARGLGRPTTNQPARFRAYYVPAAYAVVLGTFTNVVLRDSTMDFEDTLCRPARRRLRMAAAGIVLRTATHVAEIGGEDALLAMEATIPGHHP